MPGTVLCIMLFNYHSTSTDISSFQEETGAHKFQLGINPDCRTWSAQLCGVWLPPALQPSSFLLLPLLWSLLVFNLTFGSLH